MTNTTSTQRRNFLDGLAGKLYSVTLWGSNPDETDNDIKRLRSLRILLAGEAT